MFGERAGRRNHGDGSDVVWRICGVEATLYYAEIQTFAKIYLLFFTDTVQYTIEKLWEPFLERIQKHDTGK